MKLDAALAPAGLAEVPAIAAAAESAGFDCLWTTETQHDPFLPLALIAEHTSRIQLGTGIAVSFARSPATLAYTAWDLAAQSKGRFILGLGTQVKAHVERRFGMDWPASVTGKLREQIQVMRALWQTWQSGAPLNQRGTYYKITLMSPFFNPGPLPASIFSQTGAPAVPIYIAGVNTGLARLAGELCDGFLVHPFHTPDYLRQVLLPAIQAGADQQGRSKQALTISASVFGASNEKEREYCRQQVAFYASTPSYRPVMALHGWGEIAEKLSALAARAEWAQMPAFIDDKILSAFVTEAESPKQLALALQERYHGLADRLTLYLPFVPGEKDGWWRSLTAQFTQQ
ncbi:MAG: TIGR03617 family F420-dependent LLM class oxidoreductase [Anaerolineales bacterium]|jgi:probable F420-dependent oxidoreductase|nr:TIGR03617 family F420-dependent LLM class oxidoreductase [Anaerolineales bacterium]